MQRLTAMTIGAALIGLCGFAYDATAQVSGQSAACPAHEATVYFAKDSNVLNSEQHFAIVSMAEAARACGAKGVVVQASGDADRARAVSTALRQRGVKSTIVSLPRLAPLGDTMIARSVTLRVFEGGQASS